MIISIDPPSDAHDLKVSDLDLKFSDDSNCQLPNFSIRDYVFGIRNKNIACNWPFSPTSLQLCLKHEVKNLLPPFQSIDSLRNNSPSLTECSLENRLTIDEVIKSFDGEPKNNQFSLNDNIALQAVTTKSSAPKGDQESQFHLQCQTKVKEKGKPPKPKNASSIRTINKKSRFVKKVNSGVEHVVPNSETMTSKVCPVCKIFSSSSNTTLNAHIDQCLIGEGTLKWSENPKVNVVVKHRVKPRKMRLMVDIYKSAQHCTIEELDRRNGSSWATNSSFRAQEFQFQDEEVKEKEEEVPKRTTFNPEVANNEGDVYIDTNGTKVRILSVPRAGSSDNHGGRKLLKEGKRSKLITSKKKNHIFKKKHHHKYLKLSPSARKLCSRKPQAISGQEEDLAVKVADLGILRPPWACSKRTGLSKKSSGKNRKVDIHSREAKDLVGENEKSSSECYLGTSQSSYGNNGDSSLNRKKMKISLSLSKRPLNGMLEFQKEGIHMSDDNDDDDDGFVDAETRSKGSKFSSLTKDLSSAAKFNFKRKFSVDGQSQDSLKVHSRTEEHIAGRSKTSNGESSVGIEIVNQDELNDIEYVRNEMLLSNVVPTPSFMGLSTSFDPELSKQECDELYQDQICSTNRASSDVEIHGSYFHVVDPIPIPGPPGSFLPASPGGEVVSEEEIQPVTVLFSEKQSQHHLDQTIDQDSMSNSPVSTVSNSRSTSVQDDTCKKPYFSGDSGFTTEKGSSHNTFKNDHQPCCCLRKEVTLNHQDSYILRKQKFNFKAEMFPSSNYPASPASEIANFPTQKKFPVSSDRNSAAGSPSKPVLRLMGKNLTVVKTYEDEFRPPQSSQQNVIFSQYQNGFQSRHFNVHPPINMITRVDSSVPIHGGFMGSVDHYAQGSPYLGGSMHQTRSRYGPISEGNVYTAASSSKPINELIIINDSPESEAYDSMRNDFFERSQRQMNPSFTMFPSYGGVGSTMFRGGSFQTSSLVNNGDVGKWNGESPSMSHLRSSTSYYPPNYL